MDQTDRLPRVVEKFYSPRELSFLLGFTKQWWCDRAKAGELTLHDDQGNIVAEPIELAGELRIPASAVNGYLLRNPYRYNAGIKARNTAELRRKLTARRSF